MNFPPRSLLQLDFFVGIVVALIFGAYGWFRPSKVLAVVGDLLGVVGVVVGASLAAAAVLAAFYEEAFLKKLKLLGRRNASEAYLAPFMFTVVISLLAMASLLALSLLEDSDPAAVVITLSAIAGLLCGWSISSLIPLMSTLLQFVGLKSDAADVPDVSDNLLDADELN